MSQKPNPLEELPIFNFINPNKFLKIHFDYQMDLDEIRRITEFKVVLDSF